MSLKVNYNKVFKDDKDAPTLIEQYPFFELGYIKKAIDNKSLENSHTAALLLQNNLWFRYLSSILTEGNIDEQEAIATEQENTIPGTTLQQIENENDQVENEDKVLVEKNGEDKIELNNENDLKSVIYNEKIELSNQNTSPNDTDIAVDLTTSNATVIDDLEAINETPKIEEIESLDIDQQNENDLLTQPETIKNTDELKQLLGTIKGSKTENKVEDANLESPAFEPFHTVDYFASQGIKANALTQVDRLTVQLKSFTQWLKTMKKVEALSTTIENEEVLTTHNNVVSLAESSNQKKEILTENMVDVLLMQGKSKEAIQLLEKLSLQDPEKSAYFAVRIENLKRF